jgi:broad specificity phosphatase PhoE
VIRVDELILMSDVDETPQCFRPQTGEAFMLLVRHAFTDAVGCVLSGRADDVVLNASGRRQAAALGKTLSALRIQHFYVSPQPRAIETARILASHQPATAIVIDRRFDECDFGDWTGKSFDELQGDPLWRRFNDSRRTAVVPGGESPAAAQARVLDGIARISARHPTGLVAVVTHAENIRHVALHHSGMSLDAHAEVPIAPASVSILSRHEGGTHVLAVNLDHVAMRARIARLS